MPDYLDGSPSTLPPLKAVTPFDHGGIVAIATGVGVAFGLVSLLIRVYVRIDCRAAFGKDDFVSFLSMCFAIIQSSVVFLAVSKGFGVVTDQLTPAAILSYQKDLFVADIFFLITLFLTKASIALLLMRLSRDSTHTLMTRGLIVASAVYFVVSIFVVTIRCDTGAPWVTTGASCASSTFTRWAVETALDVVTEIALFIGGLYLVHNLQLPWSKKSFIVIAYGLRLPVIAAAAVRLYYLHVGLYSDDQSFMSVIASVCTQTQMAYAVVATTTPCLKPFMTGANTAYGGVSAFVMNQSPTSTALARTLKQKSKAAASKNQSKNQSKNESKNGDAQTYGIGSRYGLTSTARGGAGASRAGGNSGSNNNNNNSVHNNNNSPAGGILTTKSLTTSRVGRNSTESASHILVGGPNDRKGSNADGVSTQSSLDSHDIHKEKSPASASASASAASALHRSPSGPGGGGGGGPLGSRRFSASGQQTTNSANAVAVTVNITVSEETDAQHAYAHQQPGSPTATDFGARGGGRAY